MPSWKAKVYGPILSVNQVDFEAYVDSGKQLPFKEFLRAKTDPVIPNYQDFGIEVVGPSLEDLDLSGANLSGIQANGIKFKNVKFDRARLDGVRLSSCEFEACSFQWVLFDKLPDILLTDRVLANQLFNSARLQTFASGGKPTPGIIDEAVTLCRANLQSGSEGEKQLASTRLKEIISAEEEKIRKMVTDTLGRTSRLGAAFNFMRGSRPTASLEKLICDSLLNSDLLMGHYLPGRHAHLVRAIVERVKKNLSERKDRSLIVSLIGTEAERFKDEIKRDSVAPDIAMAARTYTLGNAPASGTESPVTRSRSIGTMAGHYTPTFSPYVPSDYPVIPPGEEYAEARQRELNLKIGALRALQLATSGALSISGAAHGGLSGWMSALAATAGTGVAFNVFIGWVKKPENQWLIKGQLGDRLLEAGVMVETVGKAYQNPSVVGAFSAVVMASYLNNLFSGVMIGTAAISMQSLSNEIGLVASILKENRGQPNFLKRANPSDSAFIGDIKAELKRQSFRARAERAIVVAVVATVCVTGLAALGTIVSGISFGVIGAKAGLYAAGAVFAVASALGYRHDDTVTKNTDRVVKNFQEIASKMASTPAYQSGLNAAIGTINAAAAFKAGALALGVSTGVAVSAMANAAKRRKSGIATILHKGARSIRSRVAHIDTPASGRGVQT